MPESKSGALGHFATPHSQILFTLFCGFPCLTLIKASILYEEAKLSVIKMQSQYYTKLHSIKGDYLNPWQQNQSNKMVVSQVYLSLLADSIPA